MIVPKFDEYKKIKNQIKNDYLTLDINNENMNFVYAFSKLIKIKNQLLSTAMKSFEGLPHRFEIFS